jgi:hypothetical protein
MCAALEIAMRLKIANSFALAVLFAAAATGPAMADGDTRPLSPAQIALFETDHLRGIASAERLEYRFERRAGEAAEDPKANYTDRIDVDVRPRADGAKDVWTDFLSGEHHMPFPPLIGFHGNPVVMFFLERDVIEMNRLTGGAATYFRNRIRQAFVDQAQMRPIEVERDGKKLSATEITLMPFKEDARLAVFPGLAEKRYRFVLADAVPGTIYEIEADAPSKTGQFSTRETMVFAKTGPCTGDVGPCAPTSPQ